MIGLFFSQLILFAIAAGAGFALGWRLRANAYKPYRDAVERDIYALRGALGEAQVRRARGQ